METDSSQYVTMRTNTTTVADVAQKSKATEADLKIRIWKQIAETALGEREARQAFNETLSDLDSDIAANTATTGSSSLEYDDISSGVFD